MGGYHLVPAQIEHLLVTCAICNYEWKMGCKDNTSNE